MENTSKKQRIQKQNQKHKYMSSSFFATETLVCFSFLYYSLKYVEYKCL